MVNPWVVVRLQETQPRGIVRVALGRGFRESREEAAGAVCAQLRDLCIRQLCGVDTQVIDKPVQRAHLVSTIAYVGDAFIRDWLSGCHLHHRHISLLYAVDEEYGRRGGFMLVKAYGEVPPAAGDVAGQPKPPFALEKIIVPILEDEAGPFCGYKNGK